jgi:8-oxo-dGTP pyrophosphatase MutT (NUDIX family)
MSERDDRLAARLQPSSVPWQKTTLRRAAVLAAIVEHDEEDAVLFLVRAAQLRHHAGQISFPGGAEDDDVDPAWCALRETEEEIGVHRDRIVLLGSLPARTSSSNFRVHCLVGRIVAGTEMRLDRREVARSMTVPLRELLQPERWCERRPPEAEGSQLPASPHYEHGSDVIWGLTGRFTADLLEAIRIANFD